MTKIDEVRAQMMQAMKEKNKERKDALSALLTALKNRAINNRAEGKSDILTEEEENQVILKEIKSLKETLEMTPQDRVDIIEECQFRISVMKEFAPAMMEKEEIEAIVKEVLKELEIDVLTAKEKGKVMKALMPKVKGKADGKLVNEVVASMSK